MRKFLALSAFLLLLAAGFLPQGEAAQFFAQHYTFTAEGQLQPPLSVEFVKGDVRPISAVLAGLHDGAKVMTLAYHEHGQIALYSFQKGNQYVLYRLRFRENQEDLLILSDLCGKDGTEGPFRHRCRRAGERTAASHCWVPASGSL